METHTVKMDDVLRELAKLGSDTVLDSVRSPVGQLHLDPTDLRINHPHSEAQTAGFVATGHMIQEYPDYTYHVNCLGNYQRTGSQQEAVCKVKFHKDSLNLRGGLAIPAECIIL